MGWVTNTKEIVDPGQWGIRVLNWKDEKGLSREPNTVHHGGNSGHQAVNLAAHLIDWSGTIILIGFDMMPNGTKKHWFGDHPGDMNVGSNYTDYINAFNQIKPADYGIEILNCTRSTALRCFPIHDLDEVLESI
jgi:hypothetical protein